MKEMFLTWSPCTCRCGLHSISGAPRQREKEKELMRRNGNRPCVQRTGKGPPKIEAGRAISIPGRRRESLQVCKQQRESVCVVRLCFSPQDITGNMTLEQPSLFLCQFQFLIFCMQIGSCCTSYLGFLLYLFANSQHGVSILPIAPLAAQLSLAK